MNQIKIASGKCIHDDNFSRRILISLLQILMSQNILMSESKQQWSASRWLDVNHQYIYRSVRRSFIPRFVFWGMALGSLMICSERVACTYLISISTFGIYKRGCRCKQGMHAWRRRKFFFRRQSDSSLIVGRIIDPLQASAIDRSLRTLRNPLVHHISITPGSTLLLFDHV